MTRDEKINRLSEKYREENFRHGVSQGTYDDIFLIFKAGVLAGIALRDEELLEAVGEWSLDKFKENFSVDGERYALGQRFIYTDAQIELIYKGSKAQHEQFIKAIKGDG